MHTEVLNLHLASPLYYVPEENPEPFGYRPPSAASPGPEMLFCFDLDETQYRDFEPDGKRLFGELIFGGVLAGNSQGEERLLELPRGDYLFAQKRELLSREDIVALAVEIQMEGLWQRLKPEKKLYLRYLFEDGKTVTQIFRPYS